MSRRVRCRGAESLKEECSGAVKTRTPPHLVDSGTEGCTSLALRRPPGAPVREDPEGPC